MKSTRKNIIALALLGVMFAVAYYPTVVWMVDRWGKAGSYYSHGYLVLPVVAFLVWRKRKALRRTPLQPSKWGIALMAAALMLHLAASMLRVHFASGLSILIWLAGGTLWLWGPRALVVLLFPMMFLISMIPMPLVTEAAMTLRLKLFATRVSLAIVNSLGLAAVQEGSQIHLARGTILVGDVCSGLRSMIALLSLGALIAYRSRLSNPGRFVLFASSLPFALAGNVVRVVWSCLAASWFGTGADAGFWHTAAGLITFAVAFGLILALEKVLLFAEARVSRGRPPAEGVATAPVETQSARGESHWRDLRPSRLWASVVMLAVAAAGTLASVEGPPERQAEAYGLMIPRQIGEWTSRELPLSDSTYEILETRDVIVREYANAEREAVYLAVIFAENNRKVAHPPEVCYAGAGYQVESKRARRLSPELIAAELVLVKPGERELVLYWYGLGGFFTPNYYSQQLRVVLRQVLLRHTRVSLVRVSTPVSGTIEEADRRLKEFALLLLPYLRSENA